MFVFFTNLCFYIYIRKSTLLTYHLTHDLIYDLTYMTYDLTYNLT
jgi:hypothetical protein